MISIQIEDTTFIRKDRRKDLVDSALSELMTKFMIAFR